MVSIQIDFLHIELAIIHRWISTRPTSQQTKILAWPPAAKKNGFSLPTPGYILVCFSTCNNVTSISSSLVSVWPKNIHIEVTYICPMDLQADLLAKELIVKKNVDRLTKWQREGHLSKGLVAHPTEKRMKTAGASWSLYYYVPDWQSSTSTFQSLRRNLPSLNRSSHHWTGYDRVLSGNASPTGKPSLLPWPLPVLPWCHGEVVTMLPFWRIQSFKLARNY